MTFFPYAFDAFVEPHALGHYRYSVVFLPADIAGNLPLAEHPRLRISCEINDHAFVGAWQPVRGRWYLMLSKRMLRETGLAIGSPVEVRFRVEPQDDLEIPSLLQLGIDADARIRKAWDALTVGKQRALAYRVSSAKSAATTLRRVAEVIDWLKTGQTDLRRLGKA